MTKVKLENHERFENVFWITLEDGLPRLATKNLVAGEKIYGEKLVSINGNEYRLWNANRSKLAAAILKKININPIKPGTKVLYLGAASGTTPSHVSDIVMDSGLLYCVEFSARVCRDLVKVCEKRKNMIPILADARTPEKYSSFVRGVSVIYSDVAQQEQAMIIFENAKWFLEENGYVLFCIKSRSIDVTKKPEEIYKKEIETLKELGFEILQQVHLDPLSSDHAFVIARYVNPFKWRENP
ncbi:MAG: fibrillarin-like rRNA/tRNA 2'-O-methyltransferase [Candidatus Lokiarchaeota archaeon]|nr:fibrillarin-like rRNA/tRNA 2'-O-methyltransferase [Candidatus Lokiarchaeota archaeon]